MFPVYWKCISKGVGESYVRVIVLPTFDVTLACRFREYFPKGRSIPPRISIAVADIAFFTFATKLVEAKVSNKFATTDEAHEAANRLFPQYLSDLYEVASICGNSERRYELLFFLLHRSYYESKIDFVVLRV